jgi:hypothetical protein
MATLSSLGGTRPTTAYYNGTPATGTGGNSAPGVSVLSGALTANTYPGTAQLAITGSGSLELAVLYAASTTPRSVTAKIVVDGVTVSEVTASMGTANAGVTIAGYFNWVSASDRALVGLTNIAFSNSLQIFIKSDITETNGVTLKYMARLT